MQSGSWKYCLKKNSQSESLATAQGHNTMDLSIILLLIATLVTTLIGLAIIYVGFRYFGGNETQQRIQSFVVDPYETQQERNLITLESRGITGNLFQRTVISWLGSIIDFLGRFTPQQTVQETQRRLTIAGNPFNLRVTQFYGFQVLFMIVGALIALSIFQSKPSPLFLLLSLLLLVTFIIGPGTWLKAMMRQRQEDIRRSLPDALDMLSVCVSAGLSFDQALLRVGQTFKTSIGIEFARVVSEIEVGVSRRQALRNLQARVDITELSSFVAVILQAETLGMSIASVLQSQAGQMRIYRQHLAKEVAQLLPAKMMVPLVLFIFPALWAVILGPTLPNLMDLLR